MKSDILFMFKLISAVVLEREYPRATAEINWENILKISLAHNITNLVGYAIINGKYEIPEEIKKQFDKKIFERLTVSVNQNKELQKVLRIFEEGNISYMPLKGAILQDLYPQKDMRTMADVDILIKNTQHEDARKVLTDLGYEFLSESDHEFNYIKKPYMHIELHKHLIPSYNDDLYKYFGDGWKRARVCSDGSSRYELSSEDNYIYLVAHFAKHYRDAGIGIKGVIDLWLYLEKYPKMDMDFICSELERLNLKTFFHNLLRLIDVWFKGLPMDEISSAMTLFILNSHTFGTVKNHTSAKSIRENKNAEDAEKHKYVRAIFPDLQKMKLIFPILEKFPILLPFFWIYRVVRLVLFRRDRIEKNIQVISSVDKNAISEYDKHMKMVGIDIYNGRETK